MAKGLLLCTTMMFESSRMGGRAVECNGLENRRGGNFHRGFKSLPIRHLTPCFYCIFLIKNQYLKLSPQFRGIFCLVFYVLPGYRIYHPFISVFIPCSIQWPFLGVALLAIIYMLDYCYLMLNIDMKNFCN